MEGLWFAHLQVLVVFFAFLWIACVLAGPGAVRYGVRAVLESFQVRVRLR